MEVRSSANVVKTLPKKPAYTQIVPAAADARLFLVMPTTKRLQELRQSFREHPAARAVRLAMVGELQFQSLLAAPVWKPMDGAQPRAILPPKPSE